MSYSFSVRAESKAEASDKVRQELDKVVASQPIHAADYSRAWSAADSFIALIRDDHAQDITVSVNGSCHGSDGNLDGVSVSITVGLAAKEAA